MNSRRFIDRIAFGSTPAVAELQDIELAANSQRVADGPPPFGERDLWNIRAAEFR
jgi:hypothetical protein